MIRNVIYITILALLAGCTLPEEKAIREEMEEMEKPVIIESHDTNAAMKIPVLPLPITPAIRKPHGIYRGSFTLNGKIEQTVAFYPDNTFRLEERYLKKARDSMVVTEGTWAPSNGYIWLYKDQIVRARYKWDGPVLHYYNPATKGGYAMTPLEGIMENKTWNAKSNTGIIFYGIGNEPFWNIEIRNNDSLSFALAGWKEPMKFRIGSTRNSGDTLAYSSSRDSNHISVTILPFFCSDGMSDYVYRNKVQLRFNNEVYTGCGMVYKP